MDKKKFNAKTFAISLEENLNDLGHKATARGYFQDDAQHINVDFEDDDLKQSSLSRRATVIDILSEHDLPVDYETDSFMSNGNITVKITFKDY